MADGRRSLAHVERSGLGDPGALAIDSRFAAQGLAFASLLSLRQSDAATSGSLRFALELQHQAGRIAEMILTLSGNSSLQKVGLRHSHCDVLGHANIES